MQAYCHNRTKEPMMQEDTNRFIGTLVVKWVDGTNWSVQQDPIAPFGYICDDGSRIIVENGFATDFASIPWFFTRILPKTGSTRRPFGRAGVLHDYLYRKQLVCGKSITRKQADTIFYEAMISDGVSKLVAYVMYKAVRIGAWNVWNQYRKQNQKEQM